MLRIGENMIRAKQTAAHVWTSVEVDFEAVERVRQEHRDSFKQREGFSLTYLPFIARATIDALRAFPVVNSSFYLEQRKAVFHDRINLGIAIDLDQKGLIVATIRDADELRLVAVARRVSRAGRQGEERKARARRRDRLELHHHQPGAVRLVHVGAGDQRPQRWDPLHRHGRQAAHRDHR